MPDSCSYKQLFRDTNICHALLLIAHLATYNNFTTDKGIFLQHPPLAAFVYNTSNYCLCLWSREYLSKLTSLEKGPYLWPALSGSEKYNVMIAGLMRKRNKKA